ncbi:DNA-binding protein HEXBP-like [Galleria mellonella]|uniref:DNA-binding protein HEXBP-like n=1 Tax=Galleria mellonella TaxID=7137 RepID=A0ABM3MZJ5_GALME|nr:DNA-binding protein HEXBP-like [Galleria mellonella]
MARVQTLEPRPMRCYRCLLSGHVAQWCTASVDTSGGVLCFRCGKAGHKSAQCTAQSPACGFCAAEGRKSDHRVGSTAKCRPRKARAPARDSRSIGSDSDLQGGGWRETSEAHCVVGDPRVMRCVFPAHHSEKPCKGGGAAGGVDDCESVPRPPVRKRQEEYRGVFSG